MIQTLRKSIFTVGLRVIGREIVQTTGSKIDSSVTESFVIEVNFIAGTSNYWCVDFGATNHICNML